MEFDFTNIVGSVKILRYEEGLPTVFLLDENHDNPNNCIDKNVLNAKELIANANVTIVGVESLPGGRKWDISAASYSNDDYDKFDRYFINKWKNRCPKFADELRSVYPTFMYGVENVEMFDQIQTDLSLGGIYYGQDIIHPMHRERSKYFVRRLFEHYYSNDLTGNLILNCGLNHNTHIEDWIKSGEIDTILGAKANYIRLNAI